MSTAIQTTREQWLSDRRSGVGASDTSAIMGINPWRTGLEVYLDKLGLVPDRPPTPRQIWGLRMEPVIAQAYAEETGREVKANGSALWIDARQPLMLATPDYFADDRLVEIKRVDPHAAKDWGEPGSDEIPVSYRVQVQQQMACADMPLCDVAALIGHCDLRIYTVPRDDRQIDQLREVIADFWGHVEREEPPLPDFDHPSTLDLLASLEPEAGKVIELGTDASLLADQYLDWAESIKSYQEHRDAIKAQLIHAMDGAELARLPDGRTLARKTVHRTGFTVEPTSFIQFRVNAPKKGRK